MNSPLINNNFYHVFNRGVEKRNIFQSADDYHRFLETINFYRYYPTPRKLSTHLKFNFPPIPRNFKQKPLVKILCFCLMPNHFHLLVQQLEDNGISEFVRRTADSFTRYFNTKYDRIGALFQGKFKAKLVESDEYLLQLSKYIHRNPLTLPMWNKRLSDYKFSSYVNYLDERERKDFCETEFILKYFNNSNRNLSYQSFVESYGDISLPEQLVIDSDDT